MTETQKTIIYAMSKAMQTRARHSPPKVYALLAGMTESDWAPLAEAALEAARAFSAEPVHLVEIDNWVDTFRPKDTSE